MSKPVIAVDIDNVLAVQAETFLAITNSLFGESISLEQLSEDWAVMWSIEPEEAMRRGLVLAEQRVHRKYPVIPGAQKAIQDLSERFTLIAVTSRRKATDENTRWWLENWFPSLFKEVIYAGFWDNPLDTDRHLKDKSSIYKTLQAKYIIDDQPKHCYAAAEGGHTAVLFGDYPWNSNVKPHTNVVRVKDWRAAEAYFDGRS